MNDSKDDEETVLGEIRRLLDEFEANFKARTSDPDNFATFSELEGMLGKLIGSTKDLYLRHAMSRLEGEGVKIVQDKDGDAPDGEQDGE
ncbi:MAG: hypothetical protein LUD51_04455 [Clostridia bacterium]|nr:hypothetical protein [Clostridia bacterium]